MQASRNAVFIIREHSRGRPKIHIVAIMYAFTGVDCCCISKVPLEREIDYSIYIMTE